MLYTREVPLRFHCHQPAVTGNFCDELTKLPEQTILSGAISLLSEGAQAQHGRVQMHSGGADGNTLAVKSGRVNHGKTH